MNFRHMIESNSFTVVVSLPANDLDLARAALERLARGLNDPETEEAVQSALEEEACHGA